MFPEDVFSNPQFVDNGKVTAAGLAELKQRMPHVDLATLQPKGPLMLHELHHKPICGRASRMALLNVFTGICMTGACASYCDSARL